MKIGGNRTLVDLFTENVSCVPEATFIRFADTKFSYGEMGRASGQFAEDLIKIGIGHGSRVALSITNRPAFVVAFLAIIRCGATVIPLNTLYKPDEVTYVLTHAECQAVVTEKELCAIVTEACRSVDHNIAVLSAGSDDETSFALESGRIQAPSPINQNERIMPDDLAGIFYTSGTTARPKGVMITHESMMYSAEVTIKSLGLSASDIPLLAFPLFHVNSLFYGVFTAIVLQGAVGLVGGFSASHYWRDALQLGATWTPGITGPIVRLLLSQDKTETEDSHAMRFAVGGMFVSLDEMQAFTERFGVNLLLGWSMTETVSLGTLHPADRPGSISLVTGIGYPTLGQEIRLLKDDGNDAGVGEPGEILYRSPGLFSGYLNDEKATREAFYEDGWFRSGDIACMDENGYLAFLDRKKEMIKTKGENVAAAEVERVLNAHPSVLESAVIGVPDLDGLWGERIEAFIVKRDKAEVTEEDLQSWVGGRLANFKVPGAIHMIDELPKTPLGKIQRQKLKSGPVAEAK